MADFCLRSPLRGCMLQPSRLEGIQPSIIKDIGRVIRMPANRGTIAILLVEQCWDFADELADYPLMRLVQFISRGPRAQIKDKEIREMVTI